MFKLKGIIIATGLLSSSIGFSGTMGPVCTPGNVTVPCPTMGWGVGIQALYLQSLYSNINLSAVNIGSASGTRIYKDLDNDFDWGFRLEGSFHFNTGNDLNVNWVRWHEDFENRLTPIPGTVLVPGAPEINTISLATRYYSNTDFDSVNAEFGQHVDFGEFKDIRFHAGAQYAQIKSRFRANQVISGAPPEFADLNGSDSLTDTLKFNGGGPRLGLDMMYNWGNGFAIYGKGAVAALVGETKYYNNSPFSDEDGNRSRPVRSSYTGLVPELDAKLGAAYTFPLAQGNLTLDVGYMVVNYFNPLHISDLDLNTAQETRLQSDFGLHGAYAGIKWIGAV
ncbi:outer membrane protein [Legionella beliardensis]|uniref:Outer membrane protein n=1 Tax=Legionella beliardensis TaxID=91822 RepID=A0A378I204_9GAMM|nr:Lpg1974 family pore-forming outer membrane protein [Legionella beliardensis]STX29209.1 outer membrane protein [Legionella beliardensis]